MVTKYKIFIVSVVVLLLAVLSVACIYSKDGLKEKKKAETSANNSDEEKVYGNSVTEGSVTEETDSEKSPSLSEDDGFPEVEQESGENSQPASAVSDKNTEKTDAKEGTNESEADSDKDSEQNSEEVKETEDTDSIISLPIESNTGVFSPDIMP